MIKYNYHEAILEDVREWFNDNFKDYNFNTKEEALEQLFNELLSEDSITGAIYFYDSEEKCEEYLCHNIDLIFEMMENFCIQEPLIKKWMSNHEIARGIDCEIRCYLLYEAISTVLDEYWK